MRELLPDATIYVERVLGWEKSDPHFRPYPTTTLTDGQEWRRVGLRA